MLIELASDGTVYRRPTVKVVACPTFRPSTVRATATWNSRCASLGIGYIAIAPTFEKFIRLDTNGMS